MATHSSILVRKIPWKEEPGPAESRTRLSTHRENNWLKVPESEFIEM